MLNGSPEGLVSELTERERQILILASKGMTDKEIAVRMSISLTTVRTYWERLRQKTRTVNRASAVALFVRGTKQDVPAVEDQPTEPQTHLDAAIDTLIGGVVVLDENDFIVAANDKFYAIINAPVGSMAREAIHSVLRRNDAFSEGLRAAHEGGGAGATTFSVFMKSNTNADMLCSVTVKSLATPEGRFAVLFIQDLIAELDARRRGVHTSWALAYSVS